MAGSTHIFMLPEARPPVPTLPTSDASSPNSCSTDSSTRFSILSSSAPSTCPPNSPNSPNASWITCSEANFPSHWIPAEKASQSAAKAEDDEDDIPPTKSRIPTMLSAVDRKRKQALPQPQSESVRVTREPSAATVIQTQTPSSPRDPTSPNFTRKQPRGPVEREDTSELRDFLNLNRIEPEDLAEMDAPKSAFDWDDSDEESSEQSKHPYIRALKRATKKKFKSPSVSDVGKGAGARTVFGSGISVNDWVKRAQDYAEQQSGDVKDGVKEQIHSNVNSDSPTPGAIATKRRSVLKHFADPVWNNEGGELTLNSPSTPLDATLKDVAEILTSSDDDFPNSTTVDADQDDKLVEANRQATATSTTSSTTVNGEVESSQIEDAEVNEATFRQIEWSLHRRGLSAVDSFKVNQTPSHKSLVHKSSKSTIIKKLKSQTDESTPPIPPRSPLRLARSSRTSSSPSTLRRRHSSEGVRSAVYDDPFTDRPSRSQTVRASRRSSPLSLGSVTPAEDEEQEADLSDSGSHQTKQQLASPSSKISSPSSFYAQWGGYPKGPEHPNWNDSVRHVKKMVELREKQEAEEARKEEKRSLKDEKNNLKRLKAGKDVILRGSQLGLAWRKSLHDLTDGEALGALVTTLDYETSPSRRSNIFSALFTKLVGSAHEREKHAMQTKRVVDRHRSLMAVKSLTKQKDGSSTRSITDSEEDNSTVDGKKTAGLGITTIDDLSTAERNKLIAEMSYQEFVALKRSKLGSAAQGDSPSQLYDGPPLSNIVEEDAETEADAEHTSPIMSEVCGGGIQSGYGSMTSPGLQSSAATMSWPSSDTLLEQDEDDDGSSWCTIDDIEETAASDFAGFQDRVNTQVDCQDDDDCLHHSDECSNYSDDIQADAVPRPLNIRVLKVKRSSTHVQPADSNSFIPDRKASFHARIQEVSRLQVAHIGSSSHPALRGGDDGEGVGDKMECLDVEPPLTPSSRFSYQTSPKDCEGGSTKRDTNESGEQ